MNSNKKTQWLIQDVLRAEFLAQHYKQAKANGSRRKEDVENHRLFEEILEKHPEAEDSQRHLMKCWVELKWTRAFEHTAAAKVLHYWRRIPLYIIVMAFFAGILVNWSWRTLETSVHVPSVLLTHALLPFGLMLAFLIFGNYFGNGENVVSLFKFWEWKLRRSGRKMDGAVLQLGENDFILGSGKHFIAPILLVYGWFFSKIERFLRQLISDQEIEGKGSPEPLDFRISLSDVLKKRSGLLKLWSYLNLQLMVVGYFFGFFVVFLCSLLGKSASFYWGTTAKSLISPERMEILVRFLSTPWRWLVAAPSIEQITATQVSFGEKQALANATSWEAWMYFLMMAIVCYAIFPRILLCVIQKLRLRHCLAKDTFAEQRFQIILDGMTHPAGIQPDPPSTEELNGKVKGSKLKEKLGRPKPCKRFCMFITDELLWQDQDLSLAEEAALRQVNFGRQDAHSTLTLDASALSSEQFKEKIQAHVQSSTPLNSEDRIVFLVDSEQTPKNNMKTRVHCVREAVGKEAGVLFLLVHEEGELFDEDSTRCRMWYESTSKWHDPNLLIADLKQLNNPGETHEF